MFFLYVIFSILVVAIIVITFFVLALNNFDSYTIRLNEAEANIESVLNKRFDLLNKSNDIIKESTNANEDVLKTITSIRSQKLNNFELDKSLYKAIEEFNECSEDNIELKNNDDYSKIEIELINSESEIVSLKKYYNDNVKKYNKLVNSSLYGLVAKLKKYKSKDSFVIENHLDLINSLK